MPAGANPAASNEGYCTCAGDLLTHQYGKIPDKYLRVSLALNMMWIVAGRAGSVRFMTQIASASDHASLEKSSKLIGELFGDAVLHTCVVTDRSTDFEVVCEKSVISSR